MAEIIKKARIFLKNGKEENWELVNDFIPGKGEMIIYNIDENHTTPRIKIGDGIHLPKELPFVMTNVDIDLSNIIAKKLEHKLTFGQNGDYQFDGSVDITVPVYTGNYTIGG